MDLIAKSLMGSYAKGPIDPYFEYTTLLLSGNGLNGAQNGRSGPAAAYRDGTFLDSSTNNFPITRSGNTTQGTFSPFSQTGWGNYFDGSGDYLSVANAAPLQLGTDNFTIEFWWNGSPTGTFLQNIGTLISGAESGTYRVGTRVNSVNAVYFARGNGTSFDEVSFNVNVNDGAWHHIAIVRSSGVIVCYTDGISRTVLSGSANISGTCTSSNELRLGYNQRDGVYITGYMSNARIVKGVAVYTGNFTPPTSPLAATQSAGTNISAITGTQTSLLTCQSNRFIDNSTNNFTITVNGDTRVVAFSPFNPTASWSAATNGGSGYFDGSGDYLETPSNSSFDLSTGNWTIDAWFYMNATGSYPQVWSIGNANSASYALLCDQGTKRLDVLRNGGFSFTIATIDLSTWYHVAIVCQSGTVRAYLNGVQTGGTSTSLPPSGSVKFSVGGRSFSDIGAGAYWNGYISSVRVVKGTAVYTANFTPPTAPLTAITNTSLLLNFTNAGIYDATSKNDLETVGNAQISNAVTPKWGSTSIKFNGTTDYLSAPDSPLFSLGSANFTIECWFRSGSFASGQFFVSQWNSASYGYAFSIANSTTVKFEYYSSGVYTNRSYTVPTFSTNTWYHIAWVRYNGTTTIYIDGVARGTPTSDNVSITDSTRPLLIGVNGDGGNQYFNGYIQDLRITPGIARYTANFTPPTGAFPTL